MLKKIWQWYNNKVDSFCGKTPESISDEMDHDIAYMPLGEWVAKYFGLLFRRIFPAYVPKQPKEITDRQFTLRVLLLLVFSAIAYGCLYGFEGLQYMFVSLPAEAMSSAYRYSFYVSGFYLFLSTAVAAFIQKVLLLKLFGRKEYNIFSVNGILFWLMGLFLLNAVDGVVYEFAGMVENLGSGVIDFILFMLAGTGMIVVLSDHVNTLISFYLSYLSVHIFDVTSKLWFYIVYFPGALLSEITGLSGIFDMRFFYNLTIVIITLILTKISDKTGITEKVQRGAVWCSTGKNLVFANAVSVIVAILLMIGMYVFRLFG